VVIISVPEDPAFFCVTVYDGILAKRFIKRRRYPADAEIIPQVERIRSMTEENAATTESDCPAPPRPVLLSDVLMEMEGASDGWSSYINRETGEVLGLLSDAFCDVDEPEDDEEPLGNYRDADREMIALARDIEASNKYECLPGEFEIHEWSIMQDFSQSVANDAHSSQLLDAIHGTGAFRHFKSTIHRLGITDDWYSFQRAAIERIAIRWLESHDFPWVRTRSDESGT
jgi:hypothetical protein